MEVLFEAMATAIAAAPWRGPQAERAPVEPHAVHWVAAASAAALALCALAAGFLLLRGSLGLLDDPFFGIVGLVLLPLVITAALMCVSLAVWSGLLAYRTATGDGAMRWFLAVLGIVPSIVGVSLVSAGLLGLGALCVLLGAALVGPALTPQAWTPVQAQTS